MKTQIEPYTGHIFECIKNNKQHSAVKGKFYLYDSGELKTYTTRNVTLLANGDEMLELPGVFERAEICPFCKSKIYDSATDSDDASSATGVVDHDGVECAKYWDAKVKNYDRRLNDD